MIKKISKHLSGNFSLRILSLILAVCLWMLVINTQDPMVTRTFSNVKVEILNKQVLKDLNETYSITEGETISFSIRGKKSVVDKMKKSDFEVTADLLELSNVNAVPIKIKAKRNIDEVEIIYGNDKTMTLEIEGMQQKKLSVEAVMKGEVAKGYVIGDVEVAPTMISVSGPASTVGKVKSIRVSVDITGRRKELSINGTPICYDENGEAIESDKIKLSRDKVRVKVPVWRAKSVAVFAYTTGKPLEGYQLTSVTTEPKHLQLIGSAQALKNLSKIKLPSVDISGRSKTLTKTYPLTQIQLPQGVSFVKKNSKVLVTVEIGKENSKELTLHTKDIKAQNVPEGYQLHLEQKVSTIRIKGSKDKISRLSLTSVQALICRAWEKEAIL